MEELFEQLEAKIRALIEKNEALELKNTGLQQTILLLQREKETLLANNKTAITHVEKMISRLKSLEGAP